MSKRTKNISVSLAFIVFGVLYYIEALGIRKMMKNDIGSGVFPRIIAVAIILLAVANLIRTFVVKEEDSKKAGSDMFGGWVTVLLLAAYVLLLEPVGFLLSTAVYLFLQILVLAPPDERNYLTIAIVSVVTPVVIYALFVYAINMPLPKGWFGF